MKDTKKNTFGTAASPRSEDSPELRSAKVAVIMGSESDYSKVEPCINVLREFGVKPEVRCLSAHRAHDLLMEFVAESDADGTEVIIAAAGMSAALPGVIAAQTLLPVIGLPLSGSVLDGVDALLSIAQMPPGVPVATVAINGSKNAAYLALRILALTHADIRAALKKHKEKMAADAEQTDHEIRSRQYI